MAFPSSMYLEGKGRFKPSGLTVEVYPSTVRGLLVELQAATANSTASSAWTSHMFGPSTGGPLRYTLNVPDSTRLIYMRARHPAGNGYSNGPFTPTITGRSKVTPDIIHPFVLQMTYQGNVEAPSGADVFVSSSKTVKVGTQPTTGSLTKTLRVPSGELMAKSNSTADAYDSGGSGVYILPNTLAGTVQFRGSVVLPPGVTVTAVRMRTYRETTGDLAQCIFNRIESDVATNVTSLTQASTGWITTSAAVSEGVTTARSYVPNILLDSSAAVANSRFSWLEVDYTMPSYNRGI